MQMETDWTTENQISGFAAIHKTAKTEKEILIKLLETICTKDVKEMTEIFKKLESNSNTALRTYDEFVEIVRKALLIRVGSGDKDNDELSRIATTYPHTIASKTVLELLEKRYLLEVSDAHAWTAFLAILLECIER